ncbi:MAG: CRISPR-associated protein (cas_TM1802) [Candidatus Methanolliviera sp. GoM_oil]|nr:MAG: CRISPR-associated protein (cas_TM1802) [Candidatus Methanolliviera sp. GoM_oil]
MDVKNTAVSCLVVWMIEAIRRIGEYALGKEGKSLDNPLDILVDDPTNRYTENILFIVLESGKDGFEYKGVNIEEYSKDKLGRYAYKKGAPNGPDITPTSMITTVESTFVRTKFLPWFKKYDKLGSNEGDNFLVKIGRCIRQNKEEILNDLKDNHKQDKGNNVVSLKIENKYLGDYDVFRKILVDRAKENFYSKYGKKSLSENQICSVCNQKRGEVYGFVDTYKFYTVDKRGFVTGGFHQEDAWKNYPVCLNCALTLEAGKKYLGNSMNFNFYGFRYLLIPKSVNTLDKETRKDVFKTIEEQKDPKFRKDEIKHLTDAEDEVLELMSKQKNYFDLNFMFYDAPKGYNGSVFNILLYIEDILPSRLRTLFDAKKDVDKIKIFKECMVPIFENKKRTGERPLEFNFGILRDFFYDYTNKRWVSKKYFLDIVNKIFTNKPIDYNFLMSFIMQRIRGDFINDNPTKISTLKGFMLLKYLSILGIIKLRGRRGMNNKETEENWEMFEGMASGEREEISQKISYFFSKFGEFFDSEAKKAVFLDGVLTQFLLNIQYQERGATPFRIKLKGLKLDEKQVKKLLPEIQNKLEEYSKNYYRTLESIISKYFISAGNGWKMPNDEISFYFVLGMNLSYIFKTKKESSDGGEKNE